MGKLPRSTSSRGAQSGLNAAQAATAVSAMGSPD